jgi:serine/threonine-protein kinase
VEPKALIVELKRRRVFRALVAYGVLALVILQIVEPVMHGLHWPDAVLSYVVVALGLGFPVVVALAWIFDVREGRLEKAEPVQGAGLHGWRLALVLTSIGVIAAAPGIAWNFLWRARPATEPPSIAVLPFADMSPAKDQEYFSDGIAEEILNALSQIDGLRVAGRTSSFSFKGKSDDLRSISQKLNVRHVLEGSVRRDGSRVRVTAQLVDASDGYHRWSSAYERDARNIFALEDEIARAIVAAVEPKLMTTRTAPIVPAPTSDPAAHELYLRGRYLWGRRNPDALRRAAELFEQAAAQDPRYALAWAGLADSTALLVEYAGAPRAEKLPKAKRAALEALQLDDGSAEAHDAMAVVHLYEWDWAAAERELRRAIELRPEYPSARHRYCLLLTNMGRCDEAIGEARRARALDPTSLPVNNILTAAFFLCRRYDDAVAQAKRTLELDPNYRLGRYHLARSYGGLGRHAEAIEQLESGGAEARTGQSPGYLAYLYGATGQRDKALAVLARLDAQAAGGVHVSPTAYATAHMGLGNHDEALAWLEKAAAERDVFLSYDIVGDYVWDPLRSTERFTRIVKRTNLQ